MLCSIYPIKCLYQEQNLHWILAKQPKIEWISKDLAGKAQVIQCKWTNDASRESNKPSLPLLTGTLVVNLGDCLQAWTKGLYRATKHRVRRSIKTDRYSVPLFFNPNGGCIIKPVETSVTRNLCFTKVVKGQELPFTFGDFSKKLLMKSHDWNKW